MNGVSFAGAVSMPAYHKRDPRSYVKQVPLPVSSQKGLKLQARSDQVYNPYEPPRDEVRKSNYDRRIQQIAEQGFKSPIHKPYKGIGDPFHLDQKKLILHALGQWDEKTHGISSSSSDSDDDDENHNQKANLRSSSTAQFMLRRTRKDLNTLPKEMSRGRDMMKNCRLGGGLFDMLQKEKKHKADAKLREIRRQKERLRTEWQPPKVDSSSEGETDEELSEDVDINQPSESERYLTNSVVTLDPSSQPMTERDTSVMENGEGDCPAINVEEPKGGSSIDQISTLGYENQTDRMSSSTAFEGPESKSRVAFQGLESTVHLSAAPSKAGSAVGSARSSRFTGGPEGTSRSSSSHRRKLPPGRPYTPQHSNLNSGISYTVDSENKQAVFRQLCCLYWLLEAMNTELPQTMSPISTSWNLKEIGGYKLKNRKQDEKEIESGWKDFVKIKDSNKAEGDVETLRDEKMRRLSKLPTHRAYNELTISFDPSKIEPTMKTSTSKKTIHSARRGFKAPISSRRFSGHPLNYSRQGSLSTLASPSGSSLHLNNSMTSVQLQSSPGVRLNQTIPEDGEIKSISGCTGDGTDHEEHDSKEEYYNTLRETRDRSDDSEQGGHGGSVAGVAAGSGGNEEKASLMEVMSSRSERSDTAGTQRRLIKSAGAVDDHDYGRRRVSLSTPVIPEYKTLSTSERALILEQLNKTEEDPRLQRLANPGEKRSSQSLRAEYNVRPKSSAELIDYQNNVSSHKLSTLSLDLRQKFVEVSEEKALDLHDALEAQERDRMRKIQTKFSSLPNRGSFFRALKKMRAQTSLDEEALARDARRNSIHQQWYTDIVTGIPEQVMDEWHFKKVMGKLAKYGLVESSKQSVYKFLKVLEGLREWEICSPDVSASIEFCREKIVEMTVEEYEEWFTQQFPTVGRPQTAPPAIKVDKDKKSQVPRSAPPGGRKPNLTGL